MPVGIECNRNTKRPSPPPTNSLTQRIGATQPKTLHLQPFKPFNLSRRSRHRILNDHKPPSCPQTPYSIYKQPENEPIHPIILLPLT